MKRRDYIDLFDDDVLVERDMGSDAFVELNKAMSAHYQRVKGAPLKDRALYQREANLVRDAVGLTGTWDGASQYELRMRRRLLNILVKCHHKNMGYKSRYRVIFQAREILDIVDNHEF